MRQVFSQSGSSCDGIPIDTLHLPSEGVKDKPVTSNALRLDRRFPSLSPRVNSQSSNPQRRHSAWQHVLQIAGALSIIGFHSGLPFCEAGWTAVELFFVMAGMHMASAMKRQAGILEYGASRYKRLLPEVALVWVVVFSFVLLGFGSPGMRCFLASAPFGLQNLSPLFFQYQLPRDSVFGALWFVAALLHSVRMFRRQKPSERHVRELDSVFLATAWSGFTTCFRSVWRIPSTSCRSALHDAFLSP